MLNKLFIVYVLTSVILIVASLFQGSFGTAGGLIAQFILVFIIYLEGHEASQWKPDKMIDKLVAKQPVTQPAVIAGKQPRRYKSDLTHNSERDNND